MHLETGTLARWERATASWRPDMVPWVGAVGWSLLRLATFGTKSERRRVLVFSRHNLFTQIGLRVAATWWTVGPSRL